ncbi:MAG: tyrosine-type recombinase/integrase [Burkholderiaceae bacterium]|nr:tyrosine-type recombinase/integrase [Burkholderiaceae bacterium]
MFAIPRLRLSPIFDISRHADPAEQTRAGNRRRLMVFTLAFTLTLLPGLTWNLSRPGEYRSTARVQISPGSVTAQASPPAVPGASASEPEQPAPRPDLLSQVQVLTSRPLFEEVARRMDGGSAGSVAALQDSVGATPVPGTDIVELQAIGLQPQRLARTLNTLVDVYRGQMLSSHGSDSHEAVDNARDEASRLDKIIAAKRTQLASFQEQSGVVSSERNENEALATMKGLSDALNKANEEAAKASGRVRSLRDAAAAGTSPVYSKDNPTLAAIEKRISETREDLRDMQRTYTPEFMAMDPTAQSLRARLAELEQQLAATRKSGREADLAAAEQDQTNANATVERLQKQIEEQRREVHGFSSKFHEAQAMEDDLTRLEGARRNAMERLAKLQASENGRLPALKILETASMPQHPWRPNYVRDGLLNLLASFLFGLLAMWFVELFNRAPTPAPVQTMGLSPAWLEPSIAMGATLAAPERPLELDHRQALPQLPAAGPQLPRELSQQEVGALLAGAEGSARLLCATMLLGLTTDEVKALAVKDLDAANAKLAVPGASARTIALPLWLAQALATRNGAVPEQTLFHNALAQPLSDADISASITCAALDAGLEAAVTVSPEVLRHSCIAHLVRQNVRFSNLAALVGQLSAGELAAYAGMGEGVKRVGGEAIDPFMPALRDFQFN